MAPESKPQTAFVISPISTVGTEAHRQYKLVLDFIIRKALLPPSWFVVRADEEDSPDSISAQVIDRVINSDLIVAVLTDHNPNVFYELAVAHGHAKPVVHLLQAGQKMPFDIGDQRAIFYDLTDPESVDGAIRSLSSQSKAAVAAPETLRNPLTQHKRFSLIGETSNQPGGGEALVSALEEISIRLQRLENISSSRQTKPSLGPKYLGASAARKYLSPSAMWMEFSPELQLILTPPEVRVEDDVVIYRTLLLNEAELPTAAANELIRLSLMNNVAFHVVRENGTVDVFPSARPRH